MTACTHQNIPTGESTFNAASSSCGLMALRARNPLGWNVTVPPWGRRHERSNTPTRRSGLSVTSGRNAGQGSVGVSDARLGRSHARSVLSQLPLKLTSPPKWPWRQPGRPGLHPRLLHPDAARREVGNGRSAGGLQQAAVVAGRRWRGLCSRFMLTSALAAPITARTAVGIISRGLAATGERTPPETICPANRAPVQALRSTQALEHCSHGQATTRTGSPRSSATSALARAVALVPAALLQPSALCFCCKPQGTSKQPRRNVLALLLAD